MFSRIKVWLMDEQSIEKGTENGLWIMIGAGVAIGLGFIISNSLKKSANVTLDRMEDTSNSGIDPDTAPAGTAGGWSR